MEDFKVRVEVKKTILNTTNYDIRIFCKDRRSVLSVQQYGIKCVTRSHNNTISSGNKPLKMYIDRFIEYVSEWLEINPTIVYIDSEALIKVVSNGSWKISKSQTIWNFGRGDVKLSITDEGVIAKSSSKNYHDVERHCVFTVYTKDESVTVKLIQRGTDELYLADSEEYILQDIETNFLQSSEDVNT